MSKTPRRPAQPGPAPGPDDRLVFLGRVSEDVVGVVLDTLRTRRLLRLAHGCPGYGYRVSYFGRRAGTGRAAREACTIEFQPSGPLLESEDYPEFPERVTVAR